MWLPFRVRLSNDIGELTCARNRGLCPCLHDGRRHALSKALLTVGFNNVCNVLLRGRRQPLCSGHSCARIHSHIKRPITTKAKAPLRVIQLR